LYVWDPEAEHAVVAACSDEHWRVREMAAKVLAARKPTSVASMAALERLLADPNPRVQAAAARALRR
jgi:HEAT repeat protein